MPALQVRDFPEELYEELRAYAEANHRSIAQQTIACVESELRRNRMREASSEQAVWDISGADGAHSVNGGPNGRGVPIPPNVREAVAGTRSVDPFRWMKAFEIESEEEREARRAKWEKLRSRFAEMDKHWKGPKPTCEEIAQMIREDRDERANRIIGNVAAYEAAVKEG